MSFAKGELARRVEAGGREGLVAAAQLLHAECFDRVALETPTVSYEPRASCHCRECAAVWIAWKSGHVMRIDLDSDPPAQDTEPGAREARTIYHLHDCAALGGGSFILVGRDDGALEIASCPAKGGVPSPATAGSSPPDRRLSRFHLDTWYPGTEWRAVTAGVDRDGEPMGITAIAAVPRQPGTLDILDILVATRRPALYVIEAAAA